MPPCCSLPTAACGCWESTPTLPPHGLGSSHGHTRIIRQAYFEHPNYVPLLLAAYPLWRELEYEAGRSLLFEIGLLEFGPTDGIVVPGVLRAAAEYELEVEQLAANQVADRYRDFCPGPDLNAVFEKQAGYLLVEECVEAFLALAVQRGGQLLTNHPVESWRVDRDGVRVTTAGQTIRARQLVITAGSYTAPLLEELALPLEIRRKSIFWFRSPPDRYSPQQGCPTFFFETPQGCFYGFPNVAGRGIKVCEHTRGEPISDPGDVDRSLHNEDLEPVVAFTNRYLRGIDPRPIDHSVCLYTMTPDEHFIIDRHPEHDRVWICCGLSGHGFKFAPALGRALADLCESGESELPIGFLSLARFANGQR